MSETKSTRRLVAAGKSVPTPGGHRATLMEFRRAGIHNEDQVAKEHYEWCDECDAPSEAYEHEMNVRNGVDPYTHLEVPC